VATGVVAVLDALGFKGIWARRTIPEVLGKLRDARSTELSIPATPGSVAGRSVPPLELRFLSDTVVLAAPMADVGPQAEPSVISVSRADALTHVIIRTAGFMTRMLRFTGGRPIAYRGALSFGEFAIEQEFLIGEAIDEAVEAERLAEGAFVWLCPSASALMAHTSQPLELGRLMPYRVPLKEGRSIDTYVVLPFIPEIIGAEDARRALADVFDSHRIDLVIKYQNTLAMLEHFLALNAARIDRPPPLS
jgi:hypothetical protein